MISHRRLFLRKAEDTFGAQVIVEGIEPKEDAMPENIKTLC
jgi:hypothetical protein